MSTTQVESHNHQEGGEAAAARTFSWQRLPVGVKDITLIETSTESESVCLTVCRVPLTQVSVGVSLLASSGLLQVHDSTEVATKSRLATSSPSEPPAAH